MSLISRALLTIQPLSIEDLALKYYNWHYRSVKTWSNTAWFIYSLLIKTKSIIHWFIDDWLRLNIDWFRLNIDWFRLNPDWFRSIPWCMYWLLLIGSLCRPYACWLPELDGSPRFYPYSERKATQYSMNIARVIIVMLRRCSYDGLSSILTLKNINNILFLRHCFKFQAIN